MSSPDAAFVDRVRGALWGLLIADALSMPVHWFYNPDDIRRQFGSISKYEAPKEKHPSSIMNLSNTGGHGRGGQSGRIIGDVINHGKHKFWGVKNMHYHQGMHAGENTLNAICARLVTRIITENKGTYDVGAWLTGYVKFMTTPGSHNDTYAESFHRDFFRNYAAGVPPNQCARGTEGHNTASVGGFVMLPPVIAAAVARGSSPEEAAAAHLRTTHESQKLEQEARKYARLLTAVLQGASVPDALAHAGVRQNVSAADDDLAVVYQRFGPACYIDSSFPVLCHFVNKYAEGFEQGVLSNANVGGENCHRGAAIGAVLGAHVGEKGIPAWLKEQLHDSAAIKTEIDAFCDALPAERECAA